MPVSVLFFPGYIYNCEKPVYRLTALLDSAIEEGFIFAYNKHDQNNSMDNGILALALRLATDINEHNYYLNIERLKNLICLAYTSMPFEQKNGTTYQSLQEAIDANMADKFYDPAVRFGGQMSNDLPLRTAAYSYKISKLSKKNQKKFWKSLQTFAYARQIAGMANPQYKYTLYMTLHLASINQLANRRQELHEPAAHLICPECKKELNVTHTTSHVEEIINLIERLIPKEYQAEHIRFIKKLYHPIRSKFVHEGNLAGKEEIGGFIALWDDERLIRKIIESDINLVHFNKALLEQFLEKAETMFY